MTKKRFVKLMMANGYSRNKANKIAASVAGTGRSYEKAWAFYFFTPILPHLPDLEAVKYPYAVIM